MTGTSALRRDAAAQIKGILTAREVVEFYGFTISRSGFIQCPFHTGDDHGSLKVYENGKSGWHCFGCGAGGSVIDFVMKLFDIDFRQAVVRLSTDFNLGLTETKRPSRAERSAILEARRREQERRAALEAEYRVLAEKHRHCHEILKYFPPERRADGTVWFHPFWPEAAKALPELDWRLDEIMKTIGR